MDIESEQSIIEVGSGDIPDMTGEDWQLFVMNLKLFKLI